MSAITNRFPCEMCGARVLKTMDDTVCTPCDRKLFDEQIAVFADSTAKWGHQHKCRSCGDKLPVSRYFVCEWCEPVDTRESEDVMWEMAEPIGSDDVSRKPARPRPERKRSIFPVPKMCRDCHQLKQPEEFVRTPQTLDGLKGHCKECDKLRFKRYYAARKCSFTTPKEGDKK
jgi:hypothetical protein